MQFSQLLTGVLSSAFLLYITYSLWTLSQLFKVTSCNDAYDHCISPILRDGDQLQVNILGCCTTYLFCYNHTMMMMMTTTFVMMLMMILSALIVGLYIDYQLTNNNRLNQLSIIKYHNR